MLLSTAPVRPSNLQQPTGRLDHAYPIITQGEGVAARGKAVVSNGYDTSMPALAPPAGVLPSRLVSLL